MTTDPKDVGTIWAPSSVSSAHGPAFAAAAVRAGRHLQPVPQPDRAWSAAALGRDPPADRQGSAHFGRDALRPGRDPRATDRDPRPEQAILADRPSARNRSRHWSASTSRRRSRSRAADLARRGPPAPPRPDGVRSRPVGSDRHAPARRPLAAHVAPGPARDRRWRRDERLRPRADRRPGPLRGRLRRVHPPWSPDLPSVVEVEPGLRVHHVAAGPEGSWRRSAPRVVGEFTDGVLDRMAAATARRRALHLGARQLLALGAGRPRHQARARPAAGLHLPHAGPGQGRVDARGGRGRHAPSAGRGRGGHHRLLRRRAGLLHGRGRADRLPLRRRPRPHPRRRPRRRPRLLRSGPPPPGPPGPRAPARRPAAPLRRADPAAQVRRRGRRDPGRAVPARRRRPTAWSSWAAPAARTARRPCRV